MGYLNLASRASTQGVQMPSYRQLHEESLAQNRPDLYRELKQSGDLQSYLDGVQRDAKQLHETIKKQLADRNPYNPVEWKNSKEAWDGWLERTAQEFVLHDRVLVSDAETERAMRDGYLD